MKKFETRIKRFLRGRPEGIRERLRLLFGWPRVWDAGENVRGGESQPPWNYADSPTGFQYVVEENEIRSAQIMEVNVAGRTLCLVMAKGTIFAVDNLCPHANSALSEGSLDGDKIVCSLHGWEFELKTGLCEMGKEFILERYPVKNINGSVYVRLNE